jgi:hypothetical protein
MLYARCSVYQHAPSSQDSQPRVRRVHQSNATPDLAIVGVTLQDDVDDAMELGQRFFSSQRSRFLGSAQAPQSRSRT